MLKLFFKYFSNIFFLTTLIFFLHLGIWIFLSLRPYSLAPPGYVYTQIGKNYFYPNLIAQSRDGSWGLIDSNTTRPVNKIYVHLFEVVLGKISLLTHIHPITMYQLAQLSGGVVLFITTLWFIKSVLPKKYHIAALLFALFVETGPLLSMICTSSPLAWLPGFESQVTFERHFGLPHHIWGEIFGLLSVGILIKNILKPSLINALLLILTTGIAVNILPPYMATVGLTVIPAICIYLLVSKKLLQGVGPIAVFSLTLLLMGIFMKQQLTGAEPWDALTATEKTWWPDGFVYERYISSLLLFIPFIVLSCTIMILRWKHLSWITKFSSLFSLSWVLLPFLYIPIAKYSWFPMANGRLTDGYQYVPAGILAAIGITELLSISPSTLLKRIVMIIFFGGILIFSGFLTVRYIFWSMEEQNNLWKNQYVSKDNYNAIQFLTTVPKLSGVMATQNSGEIIHAYANVRIFVGGPHGFSDWSVRKWLVGHFYSGLTTETEVKQLLKDYNISYVFFGPEEQSLLQEAELYPTLLTPVYSSHGTVVYKVKNVIKPHN